MSSADDADALSFVSRAPRAKVSAYPDTGIQSIETRPPTRGGTVYDQYHKQQFSIHDNTADDNKYKKTPEQMFELKMQLKYGSPLVGACFEWGHKPVWVTTMRPEGLADGVLEKVRRPAV